MAAGSAAIFFSSRMSPAAFTMHTLTVSRDTSRPAKYSIFLSLGCHIECQDSRLGPTARLLHLCGLGLDGRVPDHSTFSKNRHGRFRQSDMLRRLFETVVQRCLARPDKFRAESASQSGDHLIRGVEEGRSAERAPRVGPPNGPTDRIPARSSPCADTTAATAATLCLRSRECSVN